MSTDDLDFKVLESKVEDLLRTISQDKDNIIIHTDGLEFLRETKKICEQSAFLPEAQKLLDRINQVMRQAYGTEELGGGGE